MSDRMTPMPFGQMVTWVLNERKTKGTVFGVYRPYKAGGQCSRKIFGRNLETPIGPAAGPHTQLTQNIAASYYTGSRFFELKTVQIIDGEDLPEASLVSRLMMKAITVSGQLSFTYRRRRQSILKPGFY